MIPYTLTFFYPRSDQTRCFNVMAKNAQDAVRRCMRAYTLNEASGVATHNHKTGVIISDRPDIVKEAIPSL